ncbi:hypothetical protein Hanom_Chr02g00145601 [Helianthus anomalus]
MVLMFDDHALNKSSEKIRRTLTIADLAKSIYMQQVSDFDWFTLYDIDSGFQNVTRLTYSQNCHWKRGGYCDCTTCCWSSFGRPSTLLNLQSSGEWQQSVMYS